MHDRPFWFAGTVGSLIGLKLQYAIFVRNLRRIADAAIAARREGRAVRERCAFGYFWLVPALGMPLAVTVLR